MPVCPVCGAEFSRFAINAHVNGCLDVVAGGGAEALPVLASHEVRLLGERQLHTSRAHASLRSRARGGTLWVRIDCIELDGALARFSPAMVHLRAAYEDSAGSATLAAESPPRAPLCFAGSAEFAFDVPEFFAASALHLELSVHQRGPGGPAALRCAGSVPLGALVAQAAAAAPPPGLAARSLQQRPRPPPHGSLSARPLDQWWASLPRMGARAGRTRGQPAAALPTRQLLLACRSSGRGGGVEPARLEVYGWGQCQESQQLPPPPQNDVRLAETARPSALPREGLASDTAYERVPGSDASALLPPPLPAPLSQQTPASSSLWDLIARCCAWSVEAGSEDAKRAAASTELRVRLTAAYVPSADVYGAAGIHRAVAAGAAALTAALVRSHGPSLLLVRTPHEVPDARTLAAESAGGCTLQARFGDLTALDIACLRGDAHMAAALVGVAPPSPRRSFVAGLHALHCAVLGGSVVAVRVVRCAMIAEAAVVLAQAQSGPLAAAPVRVQPAAAASAAMLAIAAVVAQLEACYATRSLAAEGESWEVDASAVRRPPGGLRIGRPGPPTSLPPPERVARVQRDLVRMLQAWDDLSEAAWDACEAAEAAEAAVKEAVQRDDPFSSSRSTCCNAVERFADFIRALRPSAQTRVRQVQQLSQEQRQRLRGDLAADSDTVALLSPRGARAGGRGAVTTALSRLTVLEPLPTALGERHGVAAGALPAPPAPSLSDVRDALGRTPLMYAAAAGRWDLALELLGPPAGTAAASAAIADVCGDTALMHALRAGQTAFALKLLLWGEGSGRGAVTVPPRVPNSCACSDPAPPLSSRCVASRVHVRFTEALGKRLASCAVSTSILSAEGAGSDLTSAELRSVLAPTRPSASNAAGETPLFLAASALQPADAPGHAALDVIRLLVVEASSGGWEANSPLHVAAARGSVASVCAICLLDRAVTWEGRDWTASSGEVSAPPVAGGHCRSGDALLLDLPLADSQSSLAPAALELLSTSTEHRAWLAALGWLDKQEGHSKQGSGGLSKKALQARGPGGLTPRGAAVRADEAGIPGAARCADLLLRLELVAAAVDTLDKYRDERDAAAANDDNG